MNNQFSETPNTWPFQEAIRITKKVANYPLDKPIIFETGYGPSGLPHIGTFCEVFRTTLVRQAFSALTNRPTRLICFSDDMDGLRKVPDNIPKKDLILKNLGKPLTNIPDPFDTYNSFGEHNNAKLMSFLDQFGFEYEFYSSTECYKSGIFDKSLIKVMENYDEITKIIIPTLGPERQKTYSPFLPICPNTGKVLEISIKELDKKNNEILYIDPLTNKEVNVSILGGACKLQWKCDWAMRWAALEVDYEMAGKDLIDSVLLSGKIVRKLNSNPPEGFNYELFLDEKGEKISKSKGNGLTIEQWLNYGPEESLSYFMYVNPKRAKRLFFDVIPKSMDEYISHLKNYKNQNPNDKLNNPIHYVHQGKTKFLDNIDIPVSFSLLLNLASACHAENGDVIWGYLIQYLPEINPRKNEFLNKLVEYAVVYYQERVKPSKKYRIPNKIEAKALNELQEKLKQLPNNTDSEFIQKEVYNVGKENDFESLKDWFGALYQILLGQKEGPRMGSFIKLYGISETVKLIDKALKKELK
tara:strand:+ start:81 stop:1661 length:1581 start_codon:yes stop_codon:yes gene_type:complete